MFKSRRRGLGLFMGAVAGVCYIKVCNGHLEIPTCHFQLGTAILVKQHKGLERSLERNASITARCTSDKVRLAISKWPKLTASKLPIGHRASPPPDEQPHCLGVVPGWVTWEVDEDTDLRVYRVHGAVSSFQGTARIGLMYGLGETPISQRLYLMKECLPSIIASNPARSPFILVHRSLYIFLTGLPAMSPLLKAQKPPSSC